MAGTGGAGPAMDERAGFADALVGCAVMLSFMTVAGDWLAEPVNPIIPSYPYVISPRDGDALSVTARVLMSYYLVDCRGPWLYAPRRPR